MKNLELLVVSFMFLAPFVSVRYVFSQEAQSSGSILTASFLCPMGFSDLHVFRLMLK